MAYSKVLLSGSTQGKGIKVTGTASISAVTVHATGTGSSDIDEVYLYAHNSDTKSIKLTVEFGGTTSPDNTIEVTIPPESGLALVAPGIPLTGTGAAANTVKAFASIANMVMIYGWVNRIS